MTKSLDSTYITSYYIKLIKTSWTYRNFKQGKLPKSAKYKSVKTQ